MILICGMAILRCRIVIPDYRIALPERCIVVLIHGIAVPWSSGLIPYCSVEIMKTLLAGAQLEPSAPASRPSPPLGGEGGRRPDEGIYGFQPQSYLLYRAIPYRRFVIICCQMAIFWLRCGGSLLGFFSANAGCVLAWLEAGTTARGSGSWKGGDERYGNSTKNNRHGYAGDH